MSGDELVDRLDCGKHFLGDPKGAALGWDQPSQGLDRGAVLGWRHQARHVFLEVLPRLSVETEREASLLQGEMAPDRGPASERTFGQRVGPGVHGFVAQDDVPHALWLHHTVLGEHRPGFPPGPCHERVGPQMHGHVVDAGDWWRP